MKKILVSSLFFAALSFMVTGCLKDKGFEDFQYGINDPDTQPPGVGFNYGANAKNDYGLDVSATAQVLTGLTAVKLLTGVKTSSDVTVTLSDATATVLAAYNSANGTSIVALPTAIYTIPATMTIPAGTPYNDFPFTVSSTLSLDPNTQYAVAISITAVDGNFKIADNFKTLFFVFSIKNQYDGKYSLKGQFYHPSGAPDYPLFSTTVELQTTGPASVKMYWPLGGGFGSPMLYGGSLNWFGAQEPEIFVNTSTNKVIVQNTFLGATTLYDMGLGFNNAGYDSRWDPALKTFFACWGYGIPGGIFTPNGASRLWIDTLIRTGPR
jgi:BT_3987-like, N-terminal domain